jgi:ABC-type branched-subunit amino acid transport system substrate-binding protein
MLTDTLPDKASEIECSERFSDKRDWKVALLLPFFASLQMDEMTELAVVNPEALPDNTLRRQQDMTGKSFIEFYEGFLLAMDTLKSQGFNIKLFVYDTERDTIKTRKIIRELYSVQPDLVIGPVYSDDVRLAGQFARNQGINLVSPLSTRTDLIAENPNIIQVVPSEDTENSFFARHISQYKASPIILFRSDDSLSMRESWKFKKELLSWLDTDSAGNPINFRDYKLNDTTIRKLSKLLQADADNIILIFSRNEPDVTELIGKLHLLSRIHRITLFGMPAWQVWKSIDINYFHTMQMQYYSPFYIDYHDPEVIRFIKKCRTIYGFEPYEITPKGYNFCMMGYDIGLFFVSALEKYGNDFAQCMNQIEVSQLLSRYRFSKTGAGFSNQTVTMIRYNKDYTLERMNDSPEGPAVLKP